jgi:acyl carrier protein
VTTENEIKLKKVIKSICRLEIDEKYLDEMLMDGHCDLFEKFGFESLLIVELISEIEEVFNFEFDMNSLDISKLKFYDGLRAIIEGYIG